MDEQADTPARLTRRRRRVVVVVAAVVLNAAAVAFAIGSTISDPDPQTPRVAGDVAANDDPSSAPTAAGPAEGSAPEAGLAPASLRVQVTPRASGRLDVVEEVQASTPRTLLLLRPPPTFRDRDKQPRIIDLTIEADGQPVPEIPPPSLTGEWLVVLPVQAQTITLSYGLGGVTELSRPHPRNRAMLQLRPLASSAVSPSTAVVEILGVSVHNLVCPDRPLADQLCGREEADRWQTAPVPALESTVVAQVDLPT